MWRRWVPLPTLSTFALLASQVVQSLTPTLQWQRGQQKIDEDSNEVHLFSCDREDAWDGYSSTLDESNEEEYNFNAMPPEEEAKVNTTAAKDAEWEQVRQSFRHLDIEEHKKKLQDEAHICPCNWSEVGACAPTPAMSTQRVRQSMSYESPSPVPVDLGETVRHQR
jgi:hypothetical protein